MRSVPARVWLLAVLSGLLQVISFPIAGPLPYWRSGVAWFALVPLLHALLAGCKSSSGLTLRQGAAVGYLCGCVWYGGNCYWIFQTMHLYGGLPGPVAAGILLLFSMYLGLYYALFSVIVVAMARSRARVAGVLAMTPFVWVAVEFARARVTGFPWDVLGSSQVDNAVLTELAPWGGVMLISFVVVCGNAIVATYLDAGLVRRYLPATLVLPVVVAILGRGYFRTSYEPAPSKSAVLMQENLQVGAEGHRAASLTREQELSAFIQWSLHPLVYKDVHGASSWVPSKDYHSSLIVWPEAPSHLESSDPLFRSELGRMARVSESEVIAGSLGVDFTSATERGYLLYDSASLFDSAGDYAGRYDKVHLVPWGEYVPFKQFFSFAQKLTEGVGDMDRGEKRSVFRAGGHTYGVFICYESIFGDEVRQFVKNGAEVLVNISDDGWYGDTGAPWQHLNMARMRAIENHRWVLRSTNTGVTTAIDPYGRIAYEAPRHVRGAFVFPFDYKQTETFYTRHGDWFAWICLVVSALGLGVSYRRQMN